MQLRKVQTKVRSIRTPNRRTAAQLIMIGRLPDAREARNAGRFLASVRNKRVQLGIRRHSPKHR